MLKKNFGTWISCWKSQDVGKLYDHDGPQIYQYHYEEWYVYHSDLSCYVSDYKMYTVAINPTTCTI
jgi:hypothetical protein